MRKNLLIIFGILIYILNSYSKEYYSQLINVYLDINNAEKEILSIKGKTFILPFDEGYAIFEGLKDKPDSTYTFQISDDQLLYIYNQEEYDEFVNLLHGLNISDTLAIPYAKSLIQIGNLEEGVNILGKYIHINPELINLYIEISYNTGNYENIKQKYPRYEKFLNDKSWFYIGKVYLQENNTKQVKRISNNISETSLKNALIKKVRYISFDVMLGYDSNIYLIPDDFYISKNNNGYYTSGNVSYVNKSIFNEIRLDVLTKYFFNSDNSDFNTFFIGGGYKKKFGNWGFLLPYVSYLYALKGSYYWNIKTGIFYKNHYINVAHEKNMAVDDRTAYFIEGKVDLYFFDVYTLYKNYKNIDDRIAIILSKYKEWEVLDKLRINIFPQIRYGEYFNSTKSFRYGISAGIKYNIYRKINLSLRGSYEKNDAKNEYYERDYSRYTYELSVNGYF